MAAWRHPDVGQPLHAACAHGFFCWRAAAVAARDHPGREAGIGLGLLAVKLARPPSMSTLLHGDLLWPVHAGEGINLGCRVDRWRVPSQWRQAHNSEGPNDMDEILRLPATVGLWTIAAALILFIVWRSLWTIGPTEVGLVRKRLSWTNLHDSGPVAFKGEAGYQAELLRPGLRFKLWPLFTVMRLPMVQIPAGQIGVVVAQVGDPLPIGAKSAIYKPEFGNFQDISAFCASGGQKGVQRSVLPPGTVAPIHPVGFLVITKNRVYGIPVAEEYARLAKGKGGLGPESFGLEPQQLDVVRIAPRKLDDRSSKGKLDMAAL